MKHCTVCGAEAREGAKFCTSCGARLADTSEPVAATTPTSDATPQPTSTVDQTATSPVVSESDAGAVISASETASGAGDQPSDAPTSERDTYVPSGEEAEAVEETSAEDTQSPEYAASWPASDTASEDTVTPASSVEEADAAVDLGEDVERPEATSSEWGWASAGGEAVEKPAAGEAERESDAERERKATPDAESSWSWAFVQEKTAGEPDSSEVPVSADPAQEAAATASVREAADHHGASRWESWAPVAAGAATVREAREDPARAVRGLLNDLANRIDRLVSPASMETRDLDPDDLADQLGRWSKAVPNADVLLEVVTTVRKSPRDLDAVMQLADHAADLELLVRHYQSITSSSDQWAQDLRREREVTPVDEME